jgi:guanylate kinase
LSKKGERGSGRGDAHPGRRGLMFVLSSPSGAGKTTLARMLLDSVPGLKMSVSVTTRSKRRGEVDGKDYSFITPLRFKKMVREGELLEHAKVFDNFYGTPRAPVEAALTSGQDVLFDIDWQGSRQLRAKKALRKDVVSVFILPPSAADLEKRLHTRAQDSEEVIRGRMKRASSEMGHWHEYDYIVLNENIGIAFEAVKSVLVAERLKRRRQVGLPKFVRDLQRQL